ncbi:MAG: diguanylate cyclase [Actinobacteria bacterium]|nr:diguanylate cyclase [Actinomycetota bacterium]
MVELANSRHGAFEVHAALIAGIEISSTPTAVVVERGGTPMIEWANRALCDLVLAEIDQMIDRPASEFLSTDWTVALNPHRAQRFDVTVRSQVGVMTDWVVQAHPYADSTSRCWSWTFGAADDSMNGVDDDLAERFRVLSERAPIGIFSSDVGLRLGYVNDWFAELVGYPADHLLGMGWTTVVDPEDLDAVMVGFQDVLAGKPYEGPARLISAVGEHRWVMLRVVPQGGGGPASFLGTIEDITDRRRVEELLRLQATHDPLTGLKNRSELVADIAHAIATRRDGVSIVFIDLDDFKLVNDLMGHAAGDELLRAVGARLREAVRSVDVVYRYAGDEFVVLLHDTQRISDTERAAQRIHQALSLPVTIGGHLSEVGCSMGAARSRSNSTAESLLADADAAMYEAKRRGKGAVVLFDPSMSEAHMSHTALVRATVDAIESNGVRFVYEPMLCLGDVAHAPIPGPRAVLATPSWIDHAGNRHQGNHLWDAARDVERLHELLTGCVAELCTDLAGWRSEGLTVPWGIVLHLHARDLGLPGFVDHVARSLVRSKLRGDDITLVLSALDPNLPAVVLNAISQLRELGVRVWVEWSSITISMMAVGRFRPAGVAIDVAMIGDEDLANCRALLGMMNEAGLGAAARHLDDPSAVARAMSIGLRYGSGAAIGPPQTAEDMVAHPISSHFSWTGS